MEIDTDPKEEKWDAFLQDRSHSPFLQSWAMGEFYQVLGRKIWRFALTSQGEINAVCLAVKINTRIARFLYLPAGPVGDWGEYKELLLEKLLEIGTEEKCTFIRFDPREEVFQSKETRLLQAPNFTQPECSLFLDLTKSITEIKTGLSESTRYNIGWVERKGVKIEASEEVKDFVYFETLLAETAQRQNFALYKEKHYYREQFLAFLKRKQAKLFLATEPAGVAAAAVVINYGDTSVYLHAASSRKNPKLRAAYLMQWQIITNAKENNFHWYDFWGVAKDDNPKDPWAGVTGFKKGFGGERVYYRPPQDLALKKTYSLARIFETSRKPLRKLIKW